MIRRTMFSLIAFLTITSTILDTSTCYSQNLKDESEKMTPEEQARFEEFKKTFSKREDLSAVKRRAMIALRCLGYYYGSVDEKWEGKARGAAASYC
mgnify:CR=1 FL=1